MERSRKVALWWASAVAALALAGAAVVVFVVVRSPEQAAAGPGACSSGPGPAQVLAYFDGDTDMRAAAEKMRGDDQIAALDTETKAAAWERFKKLFAGQPELIDLARPEVLPASLWVVPVDGVSSEELTTRLIDELPAADEVTTQPCPMPTERPSPPTEPS